LPGRSFAVKFEERLKGCCRRFGRRRIVIMLSMRCIRWSVPGRRRARWMRPICSNRLWRGARCIAWAPPPSTNIANMWKRTRLWRGAFSRSSSVSRASPTPSRSCAASRISMSCITGCGLPTMPWWRRRTLSNRYISDRFLPDKAIDLMDEAASRCAWKWTASPRNWTSWIRRVIQFKIEREP